MNKSIVNIFCLIAIGYGTAAMANSLPLGDGKISTSPKVGYVFSCQTQFGGGGSSGPWPWIAGNTWSPTAKPAVGGDVAWPSAAINISIVNGQRIIAANNLPKHNTGIFPIQVTDPAFKYDKNPNFINAQKILLTLPANPQVAPKPFCVGMGMIGFSLSGAAIYNALDGEGRDAPAHELQDACNGHPQNAGQYHYHASSNCFSDPAGKAGQHSSRIGYALDGFGIYGLKGNGGIAQTNANLDACHGHAHSILWDGKTVNMYHYHLTAEYPYTIGCFKGTPVQGHP